MTKRNIDLRTLLDVPMWEKLQDQLAVLTGTAIITVDYKGYPITKHSGRTEFCSVIREDPVLRKRCFRCDALAALEAVRMGRPYIYLCHCGIVDVAIPVLLGDRYLGAVMFGQVRIPNNDTDTKLNRLLNDISTFQRDSEVDHHDLLEKYEALPEMEYSRILQIANFIVATIEYIVDRAITNQDETQIYEWMLRASLNSKENADNGIQELRLLQENIKTVDENTGNINKSSVVYPAVSYISNHLNETIGMTEMAALCNLSPSYFSRIFHRDVGESFVTYLNRQKIEAAKRQLIETSKSVSTIAGELGYLSTSHFITTFKRFEGTSPSIYRQYNASKNHDPQ